MKRRSTQPKRLRDRRSGKSPYARYGKAPFKPKKEEEQDK